MFKDMGLWPQNPNNGNIRITVSDIDDKIIRTYNKKILKAAYFMNLPLIDLVHIF